MKYVCFQRRNMIIPVIVPDHCTHADIKIEGLNLFLQDSFQLNMLRRRKLVMER